MTRRWTLVGMGVLYLAAAVNLNPPYPLADLVQQLPWLWEAVFGAASVTCLLCALHAPGPSMQMASFILVMTAALSRGTALWLITPEPARLLPPPNAVAWMIVAVLQMSFWLHLVKWDCDGRR